MNKREYLRSLGFEVGSRGRFSEEMQQALKDYTEETPEVIIIPKVKNTPKRTDGVRVYTADCTQDRLLGLICVLTAKRMLSIVIAIIRRHQNGCAQRLLPTGQASRMGYMDPTKVSKNANVFVKALEQYVSDENSYRSIGIELSNYLDPRQHHRFMLVWDGYNRGRQAHGYQD